MWYYLSLPESQPDENSDGSDGIKSAGLDASGQSDSDGTSNDGQSPSNSADAGAPAKRKRGRPRKYEDLTEEERKQRRAVDNRHAAKRSYYRRINKMTELEQVNFELCSGRDLSTHAPCIVAMLTFLIVFFVGRKTRH